MQWGDGAPISPSLGWQSLATKQAEGRVSFLAPTDVFLVNGKGLDGGRGVGEKGRRREKDSIVQEGHARKGPQDSISRSADQVADLQ